jgi:hypothetical protein
MEVAPIARVRPVYRQSRPTAQPAPAHPFDIEALTHAEGTDDYHSNASPDQSEAGPDTLTQSAPESDSETRSGFRAAKLIDVRV